MTKCSLGLVGNCVSTWAVKLSRSKSVAKWSVFVLKLLVACLNWLVLGVSRASLHSQLVAWRCFGERAPRCLHWWCAPLRSAGSSSSSFEGSCDWFGWLDPDSFDLLNKYLRLSRAGKWIYASAAWKLVNIKLRENLLLTKSEWSQKCALVNREKRPKTKTHTGIVRW